MTCSSHSDRRGDSGLLVGQVCRSGQLCRAKTCWHGDAGPWKVLDSVAAGRAELLSGTGVGFASSCFFTDMLNASNSQGPRSAQWVWPHTAHLHTHTHTVYTHSYTSTNKQTPKHFLQSACLHQGNKMQQTLVFSYKSAFFIFLSLLSNVYCNDCSISRALFCNYNYAHRFAHPDRSLPPIKKQEWLGQTPSSYF